MEKVKKQGMESLFCPYEQALALKELGFDEPCFAYYLAGGIRFKEYKDSQNKNSAFYNNTVCSIPTFSQVFRFFREKYGYDVSIKKCTPSEYKFEIEQLFVEGSGYYFIDFPFASYEEAELECLKKLIEIVKK